MMETFWQDMRYGVRMLTRTPGFTIVAVLSLALGIGANTTIFTIVNAVLLNPLPVEDTSRLVQVFTTDEKNTNVAGILNLMPVSRPNFLDYREQNDVFSGMVAHQNIGLSLTGEGEPKQIAGTIVSGNYFDVLGVRAAQGRTFLPEEDQTPGRHPVVVVSHGLWVREFGADRKLINRTLTLNGHPYTVIGIAPENFKGIQSIGNPDRVWVPWMMHEQLLTGVFGQWFDHRRALTFNVAGRLKPDVSLEQAQAALETIASRLEQEYPAENEKRSVALRPLAGINPNQQQQFSLAGGLLMVVVGLVLLIACANVANLLLARAAVREKEISIRVALGAGRGRLIRQLLTESLVLALTGGAVGLLIAFWGRRLLWAFRPPFMGENSIDLSLDPRVLGFTAGLSILTGVIFGLVPALQGSDPDLNEGLKEAGRGSTGSRGYRMRGLLVVAEVALALVALIGAGLFIQSMRNAHQIDPGFETEKLFVFFFNVGAQGYEQGRAEVFYQQVLERTATVPGAESSALATNFPLGGGFMRSVTPEGQVPAPGSRGILTLTNTVTPAYFETMGIPLQRGRLFSEFDRDNTPRVAVINEAMGKRFWPNEVPVGKRFTFFGDERPIEIVGVVRNSNYFNIGEEPQPCVFLPLRQNFSPAMVLYTRTTGDPETVMSTVRAEVQALDRNLPLQAESPIAQVLGQSLWAARMGAALLSIFGGLALVLAAVGIYGVMAYSVSQRTHEIGIRMTLGAQGGDIVRLILRQGMTIVAIGVGLGLVASFAVTRTLSSLLYGVSPSDPVTFAGIPALLVGVALLASYIPARRATRVDPIVALRYE